MVLIAAIDVLGLFDLVVGLPLDVVSQFLFVDHPAVVLAVVAVVVLLFYVFTRRESAVQAPFYTLDLVLLQFVPD
jgi:hypothetical protein